MGLSSGIYHHARDLGELVDTVLSHLETALPSSQEQRRLGKLLSNLDVRSPDLSQRLLLMTLSGIAGSGEQTWVHVGEELLSKPVTDASKDLLERLAQTLEQQRSVAMGRIDRYG